MNFLLFVLLAIAGSSIWAVGSDFPVAESSQKTSLLDNVVFFPTKSADTSVAFLLEDREGVWLVSSSSAIGATDECIITNALGRRIPVPEQLQVAKNCDLIRFRTDKPAGLVQAASCEFEEELLVFSRCMEDDHDNVIKRFEEKKEELQAVKNQVRNLQGTLKRNGETAYYTSKGKITTSDLSKMIKDIGKRVDEITLEINECKRKKQKRMDAKNGAIKLKEGFVLHGQVVALGPDRIEISTEISRHDKGGPVLNTKNEVVGVSSHLVDGGNTGLPEWMVEGTQFEKARQFAIRMDVVEWMPMEWIYYEKECSFVHENFDNLHAFALIEEALNENYFQRISVKRGNRDVQEWIDGHNRMIAQKYTERRINKDFGNLINMIGELEKDAGRIHRVTVPYFQEQLTELQTLYRNIREHMEKIRENVGS